MEIELTISKSKNIREEKDETKKVIINRKSMKDLVKEIIDESGDDWELDDFQIHFFKGGYKPDSDEDEPIQSVCFWAV